MTHADALSGALRMAFLLTEGNTTGARYRVLEVTGDRADIEVSRASRTYIPFYVDLEKGVICSNATGEEIIYL